MLAFSPTAPKEAHSHTINVFCLEEGMDSGGSIPPLGEGERKEVEELTEGCFASQFLSIWL